MHRWLLASGLSCAGLTLTLVSSGPVAARDPEPLPAPFRVTAGETHTCSEWWAGATCWGDNDRARLGNGTSSGLLLAPVAPPPIEPAAVIEPRPATTVTPFASLDAGPTATCALATGQGGTTSGTVWCWGETPTGRVCEGGGAGAGADPAPVRVAPDPGGDPEGCGGAPLEPAFAVAVAGRQACALVGSPWEPAGGEAWCWHSLGRAEDLLAHPVKGPGGGPMTGLVSLDGSFGGFCAIDTEGAVWCWDGREADPPSRVEGLPEAAAAVAVGGDHACAQLRDGSVWCWGANDRGQLGDGTTTPSEDPVRVAGLEETAPADPPERDEYAFPWWSGRRVLAAGQAHTCVLRDDPSADHEHEYERQDAAWCWGANERAQLGDGTRTDRSVPVRVADLDPEPGVFDLAAGQAHTCAVTGAPFYTVSDPDPTMGGIGSFRALRCWGANEHGQLGTGDRDDRTRPSLVVMTEEPRLAERPS